MDKYDYKKENENGNESESESDDSSFIISEIEEFTSDDEDCIDSPYEKEGINWIPYNKLPCNNEKEFMVKNSGVRECKAIEESVYPVDFFLLLFSEDLLSQILEYTNKNASVKIDNQVQKKNKLKLWKNLSFDEFTCFIGMLITFGLLKKGKLSEYWETSRLLETKGIAELISRERFSQIHRCLIFRDIEKNEKSIISKYELLYKNVLINSQFYYLPRQYISVDESLIGFQGRSKIKVFLPLKRKRYGLKAFLLCDSSNSYVWNWDLYKGISESVENTVMKLCMPLEGENYYIFMDRFYTTINLFITLRK